MREINEKSQSVRRELLTQASSNIVISSFGALVNVIVLAIAFWSITDKTIISIWIISLFCIFFLRYTKAKLFLKNQEQIPIDKAEKEFKTFTIVTAIILSLGIIILFPYEKPFYQAFLTMILAGLSAGAVMSLSAYKDLIRNYLIIFLAPFIFIIYDQSSEIHVFISIMILLFLILLIAFSQKYHHNIVNLIISKLIVDGTQKELQHSENNFSTIFEEATVGVFTYDTDLIIKESNRALAFILQAPHHKLINLDVKQLPDQGIRKCLDAILEDEKGFYEGPYHTKISDTDIWVSMETVPMYDAEKKVHGGLALVTDITQKIESEEKIHHQAYYDHLTGLSNRLTFNTKLEEHLSKLLRHDSFGAILFIDLDHFKTINDSLGHHIGDNILKIFSQRALSVLRKEDTLSRLGGDEFIILLSDLDCEKTDLINISYKIAEKLHKIMKKSIELEQNTLHITLSIGINIISPKEKNIHDILKHAEIAMYKAKESGRNTTCFYKEKMSHQIQEQLTLNNELHQALKLNQFELYYQPIVDMKNDDITSCETLIRWNHPEKGVIFPDQFIPYAEENDLIISIGDWVIDTACKEYKRFNGSLKDIAINISFKQFIQEDFVEKIIQTANVNGIHPSALKIELTESVAIDNLSDTVEKMNLLKSFGIQIVMDDFGTGYSSLSYLKNLPFDFIKIDRSFVKDMLEDNDDASLVKTILTISKLYKFSVIAEGVETQKHIEFLKALDCDYYQGYVKSKPIPANKFRELFIS